MNLPKISIVVPCYNQAQYLNECIESVINQTYSNWECIIVNDGSSDNTIEIAEWWVKKDNRFRLLNKENGGICDARNKGIEIAKGEWILPLDADDRIGSQYLELASQKFSDYDIIYCNGRLFGTENRDLKAPIYNKNNILYDNTIFCSAFFKKESWEKVGKYDINMIFGFEDWEFWINLIFHGYDRVFRLEPIQFFYRRKDTSRDIEINKALSKANKMRAYIIKKHSDIYAQYIFKDHLYFLKIKNRREKYEQLIFNNIFGRIYFKLSKSLSKK